MKPISVEYEITVGDYRKATYYALFLRHRRPLLILFLVRAGALAYALSAAAVQGEANMLVFYLAGAYALWGILLFAGAERTVLRYLKQKDNLLGCKYKAEFEKSRLQIRVPERKINFSCSVHHLACVFEISALFLVYATPQEVFLVPKRALTSEQCLALRKNFREILKDRFSSRFERTK